MSNIPYESFQNWQGWPPIIPFESLMWTPSLDPNNLPNDLKCFCYEAGKELEVPPEQILVVALAIIFCATQGAFEVKVKRHFKVRVSAFIIVSIVSGGKKTATFKFCIKALKEWLHENPDSKLALIDDVTPEAFATALSEGPVGLMMDEGARFEQLISDPKKNDIILKSFDGTPISIRRETKESIIVERPIANGLVMLQPERRKNISTKHNSKEYGVMARGLTVEIEPYKNPSFDDYEMPEKSEQWYKKTIHRIAGFGQSVVNGSREIGEIELSEEAKDLWKKESSMYVSDSKIGYPLENSPEWASKSPSHLLSIAGLLHIINNEAPLSKNIEIETMSQAANILRYFAANVVYQNNTIGANPSEQCAMAILDKIIEMKWVRFQQVELTKRIQGQGYKAKDIRQALYILESHNFIRISLSEQSGKPGRPFSDIIHVSPNL